MINLQKLQKEASSLISDILDLKLGVGDIVKWIERNRIGQILRRREGIVLFLTPNDAVIRCANNNVDYIKIAGLKLKQRNITLPMVLEAIMMKKDTFTLYPNPDNNFVIVHIGYSDIYLKWQLRKDGKDLSLFDQKNETIKFVIKVLK